MTGRPFDSAGHFRGRRADTFAAGALLTALVAFGPLSTDMYLPSLPSMTVYFAVDVGRVQLTLSAFLAGFALAQLFYGPLSDRFGRRPVLLAGLALFFAASIACAFAPTIEMLIAARFVQALGACSGPVLARAVVRDVHGREGAARILAYMGTAMALVPTLLPTVGGYLVMLFDWRAVFIFIGGYGGLCLLLVALSLPETNKWRDPQATAPGPMIRNYLSLFQAPAYVGYMLVIAFLYSGIFAFISGSSFVLVDFLGLPPHLYGVCFGIAISGYMVGTVTAGRLTLRLGIDRMIRWGSIAAAASGLAMAALAWGGVASVAAVVAPMFVFMIGLGLVQPNALAGAIGPFPAMAGTASAMLGFVQMGVASVIGLVVGQLHDGTQVPMTTTIAVMGLCTLGSFFLLVNRRR